MNSKHTPGPWRVEKSRAPNGATYYRIFDTDDARSCIAQVIGDGRIEYHENARLIAAAPDLLAALREICNTARFGCVPADFGRIADIARAAIARAEGRQ